MRRCTGVGGVTVFTDRPCADVGAVERLPSDRSRSAASNNAWHFQRRGGCARNIQDLVYEMTFAIDANDVNRLAGVYHWVGMSGRGANAVMDRLSAIVQRPLVDIAPTYPRARAVRDANGNTIDNNADGFYPQTTRARAPTGLRVEQTLGNTATPSRTTFGLRKHMDCWWITL